MDQTGSHRIIHPATLKWKTVFQRWLWLWWHHLCAGWWRHFKQSGGNTEFILNRSTVTSTCRCHHYREGVPDRIFHVPWPFFFPVLSSPERSIMFGKSELTVKISFCFPRCSTLCHQRNSALAISAWTCQTQLQPPWHSRSSSVAHTKRRRKPKGRIWLWLLPAYRSNLEKKFPDIGFWMSSLPRMGCSKRSQIQSSAIPSICFSN